MAQPWEMDWSAKPTSPSQGDPWDVDWSAKKPADFTTGETAADIAKATGTGLVRGVIGFAGLPGDVTQLALKGAEKILPTPAEAIPGEAEQHLGWLDRTFPNAMKRIREEHERFQKLPSAQVGSGDVPGTYEPPTTAQLMSGLEGATGIQLPEAQTTPGKYAETISSFVPAVVAGNVSGGVKNVAAALPKMAMVPGATSEWLGNKVEGTWMEPYARLLGALGGGGVSAMAGKGVEALANRAAASQAATAAGSGITPAAVARVAKNYEADALTPQVVTTRQAELGPEAMMLDMGRQLQGRAEAIASQQGRGQNQILDAVEGRTGTFGSGTAQRVGNTLDQTMGSSRDVVALRNGAVGTINQAIDQHLGPTPDLVASRNSINNAVDQVARPLYEQVMNAHDVVRVPDGITGRPVVAQAMRDAVSLARNHGEQLTSPTETRTILAGPGYHIAEDVAQPAQTSLRYWDYVKKALDARVNGMLKSGGIQDLNSQDKADLTGLMAARTALVNHLDNVTGGAYGVARRAAATKFQVNEATDLGRSALNSKLLPEELGEEMQGMSLPEQAGVRLGMRREMQRVIDMAPDDAAAARRMLDTNQNRQKIARVFGQPAADALDRWIGTHDALDVGRNALNTRQLPEELAARMQNMGPDELELARAGMRREIDRIIDTARNDGAAARRILDTNQNREKIAQVFGQQAANEVDRRIAAETQFQDATNKISGNSRTAVRQELRKETEAPSHAAAPSTTVLGLGHAALRRGQQYLGDLALERTKEGIADLLTRRGNDIPTLARILSDYSAARTANAPPPIGQQTRGLASILASQAPRVLLQYPRSEQP